MTRAHCVPSVEFCDCAKVYEPVHLDCFPEVSRRVCRYPSADIGYLEKLCLAFGIALTGRHFFGKLCVSFSKDDDCVAGNVHTLQLLVFCRCFGIFEVVQLCACFSYLFFKVEHAISVDKSVKGSVSKSSLLTELSESSGFVKLCPVLRHAVKKLVSHAAAAPERNDLLFISLYIFRIYSVVLLFSDV